MTKHFPGAGPERDDEDSHFVYGQHQIYPGDNPDYHLEPSRMRSGREVGFGFHKGIVTELLKGELGFRIVCSDWGLVSDVEILAKVLNAGCNQLGGEWLPELVVVAVERSLVSIERVNGSARKLLSEKFELGLFENPFVDPEEAVRIVGHPDFVKEGETAQRDGITLLVNKGSILPLHMQQDVRHKKLYVEGVDHELLATGYGLQDHAGTLEWSLKEKQRQAAIFSMVPATIVDIYLDRPAAVPELFEQATAVVASYGSNPRALLDVLFAVGGAEPKGRLPFDLPSSDAAVQRSREDVPFDTENPTFRYGHGLAYKR
ncbi:glycoside hydrolase superfamily [Aspergillus spectabilis]